MAFDIPTHMELWKKSVDVQTHFNDIGWRIRALGLTALTFTFGTTFIAYTNGKPLELWYQQASPASLIPIIGLVLWASFWFMDAAWYHRLLIGAVKDAARLEALLQKNGIQVELGKSISESSRVWFFWTNRGLHSTAKLNVYYGMIGAALLFTAWFIFTRGA